MSRIIYKYDISVGSNQALINVPHNAKPLCVQVQHDGPKLWMEVETDNQLGNIHYDVFGTGHIMLPLYSGVYVGT